MITFTCPKTRPYRTSSMTCPPLVRALVSTTDDLIPPVVGSDSLNAFCLKV